MSSSASRRPHFDPCPGRPLAAFHPSAAVVCGKPGLEEGEVEEEEGAGSSSSGHLGKEVVERRGIRPMDTPRGFLHLLSVFSGSR